jgi:hypothetical protein
MLAKPSSKVTATRRSLEYFSTFDKLATSYPRSWHH